jgi:hypothetical protein
MPRIVYSLRFETERQPGEPITEFIVPLDRQGNSAGDLLPIGKRRAVDLRPGDFFVHGPTQKRYKLTAMSAYRQHELTDERVATGRVPLDGYLVAR